MTLNISNYVLGFYNPENNIFSKPTLLNDAKEEADWFDFS